MGGSGNLEQGVKLQHAECLSVFMESEAKLEIRAHQSVCLEGESWLHCKNKPGMSVLHSSRVSNILNKHFHRC